MHHEHGAANHSDTPRYRPSTMCTRWLFTWNYTVIEAQTKAHKLLNALPMVRSSDFGSDLEGAVGLGLLNNAYRRSFSRRALDLN